jgi:RHS repeat-associated protein
VGTETTTYAYDVFGNLLNATLPSGTALAYVVDGQNRRVGTQVNGALESGFLYQDQLNAIAQLNGSGSVVSRFVFGSKGNVPDYFTSSAGTFRMISDHLGSPKVIVNSSSGAIVEEVTYDEFGNVVSDTNPGLTPFGFAGGLYDENTGLVRFGARDYDPSTGRWTSKDVLRFNGWQVNLYGYASNDPINHLDRSGLITGADDAAAVAAAAAAAAVVAIEFVCLLNPKACIDAGQKLLNACADLAKKKSKKCTSTSGGAYDPGNDVTNCTYSCSDGTSCTRTKLGVTGCPITDDCILN